MPRFHRPRWLGAAVVAGAIVVAGPAAADRDRAVAATAAPDYFAPKPRGGVKIRAARERCRADKLLIAGLLGGAALATGAGVYFHLDSWSTARDVAATRPTSRRWSERLDDTYDRGQRSGTISEVSYAVAGSLAIGTLLAVWRTDPGEELVEVRLGVTAAAVAGGGVVGAAWRF